MNENSPLTIKEWLDHATTHLESANVPTARLDAQVILSHALKMPRASLLAHPEQVIEEDQLEFADKLLARRIERQPVAYLTEQKEFYGRNFYVAPDVLIPRPESEAIIDTLALLHPNSSHRLIDIGTGSGCLSITAALEFPGISVTAVDISNAALSVAKRNAESHSADVRFVKSNLLSSVSEDDRPVDFIIANLPYVDKTWERSPETDFEPSLALFAEDDGLALIKQLIPQVVDALTYKGSLILEADPQQHMAIIDFAREFGFTHRSTDGFIISLQRAGA